VRSPAGLARMGTEWLLRSRGPLTGRRRPGRRHGLHRACEGRARRRAVQRDAALGRQAGRCAAPLLGLLGLGGAMPAAFARARRASARPIRWRRRASSRTT
jgi:hypothetical protein